VIVQKCSSDHFVKSDPIIQVSNAKFWLDVAAAGCHPTWRPFWHQHFYAPSPHLAQLVAEFCILPKNQNQLDADTLDKLAATLRWNSHALLETCLKLMLVEKAVRGRGRCGLRDLPTSLQKRCAYYIGCGDWRRVLEEDNGIQKSLEELGPHARDLVMDACRKRANCEEDTLRDVDNNPGNLPMSIVVADAGVPEVNGVYVRSAIFDLNRPRYEHGKQKRIIIREISPCFSGKPLWEISCVLSGPFYIVPAYPSPISKFPPKTCWIDREGNGEPFPTLTYNW